MEEPRRWTAGTPGRTDVNGVEWFACDPYPTWYRWVNGRLHTQYGLDLGGFYEEPADWADGLDDEGRVST